jgi:ABC-type transport system involved in multi-copper enzyme maturation permease subunit
MAPGGLNRVVAVAANTFRESVRERVLYNLLVFAVLMTLSSLILGELSIRQDDKIVKDLGLASMDVFGTLIAIFIGVGLIRKEIERRSLYPLLAKPLGRGEFLLGKFLGLGFTLLVNVALMTLGLFAALFMAHRSPDPDLIAAVYAIFLGLLLTVGIALLFSTLASSQLLATLWTFSVVVAGRFSDVIRGMSEITKAPRWLGEGLYYALPNYRNFDLKTRVVYGESVPGELLLSLTAYALLYLAIVLLGALAAFRRRELQ